MRCGFATWRGSPNETPHAMLAHRGLVLHVEEGTEPGTCSWFQNRSAQASAHFGVGADGALDQFVDTDDKAWAEAAGNPYWVSVETEGRSGEAFSAPQIDTLARLYNWLALAYRFPFTLANSPAEAGLGFHAMGGAAWGGHFDCPGQPRIDARPQILRLALESGIPNAPAPMTWRFTDVPAPTDVVRRCAGPRPGTELRLTADGGIEYLGFGPGERCNVVILANDGDTYAFGPARGAAISYPALPPVAREGERYFVDIWLG